MLSAQLRQRATLYALNNAGMFGGAKDEVSRTPASHQIGPASQITPNVRGP